MADFIQPTASDGGAGDEPDDRTASYSARVGDWPASMIVVDLVASIEDRDATEMTPLYGTIDPDALDSLVDSFSDSGETVSFTYAGHDVTVEGDGTVTIAPVDE